MNHSNLIRVVALLLVFGSPALSHATGELAGTLPGDLVVDNKGAANYSIPLQVPPGVNGMQPSLTLSYNSQAGNGEMGIGWGFSTGFPQAITRGRSFLARHGIVRGVNFDSQDKFYLDGKLLICVSGTYGAPGSVYRTEVDSFVTITASGSGNSSTNWKIESFILRQGNGTTLTFGKLGTATDACHQMSSATGTAGSAYAYAIKQVRNILGDTITYNYVSPVPEESVLDNIQYGANDVTGASNICKVKLHYNESVVPGNPAGNTQRLDRNTRYVGGWHIPMTARLDRVETGMISGTGLNTTAEYDLDYEYAPNMGPTRLVSVSANLFGYANNGTNVTSGMQSVPATTFTWSNSALQYRDIPVSGCPAYEDIMNPEHFAFGDVNGDGFDDRVIFGSTITVELSNGTAFQSPQNWLTPGLTVNAICTTNKLADVNGDGRKDLIIGCDDQQGRSHVYAYLSTGTSFVGVSGNGTNGVYVGVDDFGENTQDWISFRQYESCSNRFAVADFSGDGRDDILIHRFDGKLKLLVSNGASFSAGLYDIGARAVSIWPIIGGFCPGIILGFSYYNVSISMMPCDVNGDGIVDYVWSERTGDISSKIGTSSTFSFGEVIENYVSISSFGGGFQSSNMIADDNWNFSPFAPSTNWYYHANSFAMMPGDMNGDGITDLSIIQYRANGHSIVFSTGASSGSQYSYDIKYPTLGRGVSLYGVNVIPWFEKVTQSVFEGVYTLPGIGSQYESTQLALPMIKLSTGDGYGLCDVNMDGKDDYVWYADLSGHEGWYVMYNIDGTYSNPMPISNFPWLPPSHTADNPGYGGIPHVSQTAFDLNGDGVRDYALCDHYSISSPGIDKYRVSEIPLGDKIIGITNGLGQKTEIKYKPTSDSSVYTRGPVDNPSTTAVEGVQYPIREVEGSMYVVSDVYKDYGNGDAASFGSFGAPLYDSQGHKRNVYVVSYQYAGGRTDLSGRGFLGFQAFVTLDRQTNLFKYQFLAQSFPMTGLAVREQTYHALSVSESGGNVSSVNLRLLSSKDNVVRFDFVRDPLSSNLITGTLFPYTPYSWERRWEDSATAHFTGISESMTLFQRALPSNPHSSIIAYTWLDGQNFTTSSLPTLPTFFSAAHSNETAPSASGFASTPATATPVGTTTWSTFMSSDHAIASTMSSILTGKISYGNLKRTLINYSDGYQTDKVTTYFPVGTSGRTDLVDKTQTSATTNGSTWIASPVTRFTYESRGLPVTKAIDTDASDTSPAGFRAVTNQGSTPLHSTETYAYNSRGQQISTQLSGDGITTRYTSRVTAWDPTGRFPKTVVDDYGHATTSSYDALGHVVESTNFNNECVKTHYDGLGRVVNVHDELRNLTTVTSYGYTSGSSGYSGCQVVEAPGDAGSDALSLSSAYYMRVEADGAPPVTTYYDRIGRTIRTIKEGYAGQMINVDTIYNRDGEVVAVSNPSILTGTNAKPWTITTYDDVGRVKTVRTPNGAQTKYTYSGRVKTTEVRETITSDSQSTTTLANVKGETIAVWNPGNTPGTITETSVGGNPSVRFTMDGFGRVLSTGQWQGGSTYVNTASTYDAIGNQITLNDPDKGSWQYHYNSIGQLVRQQDPTGNVTVITYDTLNRQLTRTITEASGPVETTNWYYYETDASKSHAVVDPNNQWIGTVQREVTATAWSGHTSDPLRNYTVEKGYYYDPKGRMYLDLHKIDGKWYYRHRTFDHFGRPLSVDYYWRPPTLETNTSNKPYLWQSYGYLNTYDPKGYVTLVRDTQGKVWWRADATSGYDYMDRPVLYQKGGDGSYWTSQLYSSETGLLEITTTGPLDSPGNVGWIAQRNEYQYDKLGNLKQRKDVKRNVTETFAYDNQNRLLSSSVQNGTGASVLQESVSYAVNGNIATKTDVGGVSGTFTYGTSKTHAVTSAFGYAIGYDANGNVNSRSGNGDTWSFNWTGFDKPRWMAKSTSGYLRGNAFLYGPDHMRVVELEFDSMTKPSLSVPSGWTPLHYTDKKIYVSGGAMEVDYKYEGTTTPTWNPKKVRIYIPSPAGNVGSVELKPDATAASDHKRLVYHYDHLGSIQAITLWGENSQVYEQLYANDAQNRESLYSYDPWGQRRDAKDWKSYPWTQSTTAPVCTWGWDDPTTTGTNQDEDDLIPRGFTGHEMLDDLGLVHMNGRIYDARLSRFLSADQIVQAPYNLQSYNRYTYCFNNPTGYVDPSGYMSRQDYIDMYGPVTGNMFYDIDTGNAAGCSNLYNSGDLDRKLAKDKEKAAELARQAMLKASPTPPAMSNVDASDIKSVDGTSLNPNSLQQSGGSADNCDGSLLGDFLSEIWFVGWALGPIGDVLSGLTNILCANFSEGLGQVESGVADFLDTVYSECGLGPYGFLVGKVHSIYLNFFVHPNPRGMILSIIIPHWEAMTGPDHGYDPNPKVGMDNRSWMGRDKLEYSGLDHDTNTANYNQGVPMPFRHHWRWIKNAWTGPGKEPGPFGQVIRLAGTPFFFLAGLIEH